MQPKRSDASTCLYRSWHQLRLFSVHVSSFVFSVTILFRAHPRYISIAPHLVRQPGVNGCEPDVLCETIIALVFYVCWTSPCDIALVLLMIHFKGTITSRCFRSFLMIDWMLLLWGNFVYHAVHYQHKSSSRALWVLCEASLLIQLTITKLSIGTRLLWLPSC